MKGPPAMLNATSKGQERSWIAALLLITVFLIILILGVTWGTSRYFIVEVKGSSMCNTLYGGVYDEAYGDYTGGDILYAERTDVHERGDVVIIDVSSREEFGEQGEHIIIKRLIAVAGDSIKCENGVVWLAKDGGAFEKLDEPYVRSPGEQQQDFRTYTLAEGEIFVMGDNRAVSKDSRFVGALREDEIIGTVPAWSIRYKKLISGWESFRFALAGCFSACFGQS